MPKINKYKAKRKSVSFLASLARYLILIAFAYILFYPFLFMGINTFKTSADWLDPTVQWVPKHLSFNNIKVAFIALDYVKSVVSTFKNEIVAALLSFFSCAVAGYGLARFDFRGKKLLIGVMILFILIPDPMIMVASYSNFGHLDFLGILGLLSKVFGTELRPDVVDGPLVFWLPALFSVGLKNGLFIYIYMQFFKGLPKELEEAAWMDGAGPWKTFLRIVLPSSGAAAITVLVFSVVWYWNDYYQAQIYLSGDWPVSVVLANFKSMLDQNITRRFTFSLGSLIIAASFLSILPLLTYFLFMQRKFVQSISTCGIVG
ncbi:MAG: carbohydrate ABC transporter permease [Clostridia bacterium]|nr:carbohydrate ABC transporter permease [Clostridia bacterium]